jgi:hypothetical protein
VPPPRPRDHCCLKEASRCFTIPLVHHPKVQVEMARYRILCHRVGGPISNPPGTCRAIIDLVSLQAKGNTTCDCAGSVLPPGRVVGRVNGTYVNETISGCLCGLNTTDANQAAHDRTLLMPRPA